MPDPHETNSFMAGLDDLGLPALPEPKPAIAPSPLAAPKSEIAAPAAEMASPPAEAEEAPAPSPRSRKKKPAAEPAEATEGDKPKRRRRTTKAVAEESETPAVEEAAAVIETPPPLPQELPPLVQATEPVELPPIGGPLEVPAETMLAPLEEGEPATEEAPLGEGEEPRRRRRRRRRRKGGERQPEYGSGE